MITSSMESVSFQKDQAIFQEGDYADCMCTVQKGRVGIYKNYGKADEQKLTELSEGEVFGEMGLLECYPRSATAIALEDDTQLQVVSIQNFSAFFANNKEKVYAVFHQLTQRLRELTQDYVDVCHTIAASSTEKTPEKSGWLKAQIAKFSNVYSRSRR